MRTAICLHGLSLGRNSLKDITRSNPDTDWKRFTESIINNLIIPNNADVFIHTWDHEEVEELKTIYNPKAILVEPQMDFNPFFSNSILDEDKEDFGKYMSNNYTPLVYAHPRIFSHLYSFEKADSLRQSYESLNNFKYDYVVKTRFDLQMLKPHILEKLNTSKIQIGKSWFNHKIAIEDLFIVANSENMKSISSAYHKIYEYYVGGEYNTLIRSSGLGAFHFASTHELLHYHFAKSNLLPLLEEVYEREIDFSLDRDQSFDFMETNKDIK